MNINNLKINTQFKIGLTIPMLFVIVLGVISYIQSYKLQKQTETLYNHPLIVGRAIGMLRSDIYALNRDIKDLAFTIDDNETSIELDWIRWWRKEAVRHIDTIYSHYLGPLNDVDLLKQDFDTIAYLCDQITELMNSGKNNEVFSLTKTNGIVGSKIEILMGKLQVIDDFAIKKGDELIVRSENLKKSLDKQLFLLVAVILLFSLIINIILLRNISKPLEQMTGAVQSFNEGDTEARCSYSFQNEFGILAASFNNMVKLIKIHNEKIVSIAEELGYIKGKEEENESINEELSQVNNDLQLALAKAEESDRLKTAFLYNISHEIRTPMNGILGFSELLKEPELTTQEQHKYIDIIEKSGDRMINIIDDLINISKIESGQITFTLSVTNIIKQIEDVYLLFNSEVEKKDMHFFLKNNLSDRDAIINTDQNKVNAILMKLVKNAIKFTNKGSIELGCEKKGEAIEFFVKDTGIGIDIDKQKLIFERFMQVDVEAKNANQGAGLGLSISKAYVEILGGRIWVKSELGVGSTFYFTIPYNTASESKEVFEYFHLTEDFGIQVKPKASGLKILIVEDDENSEIYLSEIIKPICKEILLAKSGIEAVEACIKNRDIDLVLMDIQMPGMSGYEATMQIRKFNKDVIIIAQTAFALSGDREKALKSGCNDYITKPIAKNSLFVQIQQYFNVGAH